MFIKKADTILMAITTGVIVANIYYCQPLIVLIAHEFSKQETQAGSIVYYTQCGYALGLLFLVPLGDMVERKKQITIITSLAIFALIAAALAPSFFVLSVASLLLGFTSIVPQLILPLSANLANPQERGKVIGTVMSGLLIGILLSRTLSGAIAAAMGWRAVYWVGAALCSMMLVLINRRLPKSFPDHKGNYKQLMQSILNLFITLPQLRKTTFINALAFATFSSFWTTMVLLLSNKPYLFHADTIGLFGLAGVAGALAAPLIGKLGDKKNPKVTIAISLTCMLVAIALFYFGGYNVVVLIVGILIFDLGQQGVYVSNQTIVYALVPAARNRLNTIFMTISFIGAASGSAVGLYLWKYGHWQSVCICFALMVSSALIIHLFALNKKIARSVSGN